MLAAELKRSATISFAALVRSSTSTERSESDLDGEEKVSHAKSFLSEAISLSYLSPLKRSEIEAEKKKKKASLLFKVLTVGVFSKGFCSWFYGID